MSDTNDPGFSVQRPWDARLARWLVAPLRHTWVVPNHLTTVRLIVGLAAAVAFIPGKLPLVERGGAPAGAVELSGPHGRGVGSDQRQGQPFLDISMIWAAMRWSRSWCSWRSGWESRTLREDPGFFHSRWRARRRCGRVDFLFAHAYRGVGRQIRDTPGFAGRFETEDALYLLPLITLFHGLEADAGGGLDHCSSLCRLDCGRVPPADAPLATRWAPMRWRNNINASNAICRSLAWIRCNSAAA